MDKSTAREVRSASARSALMSRVRRENTAPEIVVRKLLHSAGFRFRLHRRDLPGSPDIVLPKHKSAIFVHGCFWHAHEACPRGRAPKTRTKFWSEKRRQNRARDAAAQIELKERGWDVLVVWECDTKSDERLKQSLQRFLRGSIGTRQ
jgi:DNA mismatch endonuclease (patch repair protein)